jgi:hypothetical protein
MPGNFSNRKNIMGFFDGVGDYFTDLGNSAVDIVAEGALSAVDREVDEEFDDEIPYPQDDRTFITTGFDAPVNAAGQTGFSLAKITGSSDMLMIGGAIVAAVVLIKLVK